VELRDILPLILWPWLVVSMVILIRRRLNRDKGDRAENEAAPAPTLPTGAVTTTAGRPSPGGVAPGPSGRPSGSVDPPGPPTPGDTPPATASPTSTFADPASTGPAGAGLASTGPAGTPGGETASIFDEPDPVPEPTSTQPIATMVSGIQMPCDLAPLIGAERPLGAREAVTFVTRTHDAASVGRAMGAELRRLGFTLHPRHATEVVATRDSDALAVTVHDKADEVKRSERPAFPAAGEGSVVVELWRE
jgi:hypothetical protein